MRRGRPARVAYPRGAGTSRGQTGRVATAKRILDKRVFDVRAQTDRGLWLLLAVSGDATLADLHIGLLGAFEWPGQYTDVERIYRFDLGEKRFQKGGGSRTTLRKVLTIGTAFEYACEAAGFSARCDVVRSYEVPNRRHYPKVIDAHPDIQRRSATWRAQIAMRREYRQYEREERHAVARRSFAAPAAEPDSPYARGFFAAIVAGPMVMPTKWLQRFMAEQYESIEDMNATMERVMTVYNKVADQLHVRPDDFVESTLAIAKNDTSGTMLVDWQRGFVAAIELSPAEWGSVHAEHPLTDLMAPIAMIAQMSETPSKRGWLTDQKLRENLGRSLGIMTVRLWELWHSLR
jgi:yecA family protein